MDEIDDPQVLIISPSELRTLIHSEICRAFEGKIHMAARAWGIQSWTLARMLRGDITVSPNVAARVSCEPYGAAFKLRTEA